MIRDTNIDFGQENPAVPATPLMPTAQQIKELGAGPRPAWVLYDGTCPFCTGLAERYGPLLHKHGFELATLGEPWVRERLGLAEGEIPSEMKLVTTEDRVLGGTDALLEIARGIAWARPLAWIGGMPGIYQTVRAGYRWFAARRHCVGGACAVPKRERKTDFLPLVGLTGAAMLLRELLPAWIYMWTICVALFAGLKWITWIRAVRERANLPIARSLGFLFLWPGMNADEFLKTEALPAPNGRGREIGFAAIKLAFGAALFWGLARVAYPTAPILAGWIGMTGLIFILHFGLFHILALAWQARGIAATPIMNAPIRATSLAEFWSERWNLAFRDLTNPLLFRPLTRRWGVAGGTLAAFAASGLVHELVISVPAGAGYGLPTLYFALQGVGLLIERSAAGKAVGLRTGAGGWIFTMLVVAGPAYFLFHPAFVDRVVLPMMQAIGAI